MWELAELRARDQQDVGVADGEETEGLMDGR
jgi:hypothetical protein